MPRKKEKQPYTVICFQPRNVSEDELRSIAKALGPSLTREVPADYEPTKKIIEIKPDEIENPNVAEIARQFLQEHPDYYASM